MSLMKKRQDHHLRKRRASVKLAQRSAHHQPTSRTYQWRIAQIWGTVIMNESKHIQSICSPASQQERSHFTRKQNGKECPSTTALTSLYQLHASLYISLREVYHISQGTQLTIHLKKEQRQWCSSHTHSHAHDHTPLIATKARSFSFTYPPAESTYQNLKESVSVLGLLMHGNKHSKTLFSTPARANTHTRTHTPGTSIFLVKVTCLHIILSCWMRRSLLLWQYRRGGMSVGLCLQELESQSLTIFSQGVPTTSFQHKNKPKILDARDHDN